MTKQPRRGPLLWLSTRSRRFWIVVALLLPVFYIASLGPVARLGWVTLPRGFPPWLAELLQVFYYPLSLLYDDGPAWYRRGIDAYCAWWCSF